MFCHLLAGLILPEMLSSPLFGKKIVRDNPSDHHKSWFRDVVSRGYPSLYLGQSLLVYFLVQSICPPCLHHTKGLTGSPSSATLAESGSTHTSHQSAHQYDSFSSLNCHMPYLVEETHFCIDQNSVIYVHRLCLNDHVSSSKRQVDWNPLHGQDYALSLVCSKPMTVSMRHHPTADILHNYVIRAVPGQQTKLE